LKPFTTKILFSTRRPERDQSVAEPSAQLRTATRGPSTAKSGFVPRPQSAAPSPALRSAASPRVSTLKRAQPLTGQPTVHQRVAAALARPMSRNLTQTPRVANPVQEGDFAQSANRVHPAVAQLPIPGAEEPSSAFLSTATEEKPRPANPSELLSRREAAQILALHPNTINNMIKRGELVGLRVAGSVRVRRRDVMMIIEHGTNTSPKRRKAKSSTNCEALPRSTDGTSHD
jgi:excisionase family DNA binding protein